MSSLRITLGATLLALCASACAPMYTGKSETLRPDAFQQPGWVAVKGVPALRQEQEIDCGPVALAMVAHYWEGNAVPHAAEITQRVSAAELRDQARARGYNAFLVVGTPLDIQHELEHGRPMIVGMAKPTTKGALAHYEVVVGLNKRGKRIATLDPALGPRDYALEDFLREWIGAGRPLIVLLGPPRAGPAKGEPPDPSGEAEVVATASDRPTAPARAAP